MCNDIKLLSNKIVEVLCVFPWNQFNCFVNWFHEFWNLKHHVASFHEKSKLYSCDICEKSFTSGQYLGVHFKTQHEDLKLFKCKTCCKEFASNDGLLHHQRSTHENRTYECSQCPKIFKSVSGRREHIKSKHQKTDTLQILDVFPWNQFDEIYHECAIWRNFLY